jgi:hydrogenase maturation protease
MMQEVDSTTGEFAYDESLARRRGRSVVLGLGNPVLGDDRVGLAVAERVETLLRDAGPPHIDVVTSFRGGFELLDLLHGYERAFVVDCVIGRGALPGSVHRLRLMDVAGSARLVNAHEIDLFQVFQLAAHLGIPMPWEITISAIESDDASLLTEVMSDAVRAAVEPVAREIFERLRTAANAGLGSAGQPDANPCCA